ncbi:CPBP family intramembrane glutamic endopeptidase [Methanobrevibacter millerae]|uniref:CAAX protease self-immunity n=1 Tax=Methanobrevibacter millerae TaxID=230361 RepID=A0A1G5VR18_9EURY|nr:type II CAAX endopeptidase family protein [Methanobrevibacter millerae]SDA47866.1 CAAX protease self-immunity [Methanobrevibacter millerae]
MNNDKISDYTTFPRTFENYKWYKPILVLIVSLVLIAIFEVLVVGFFYILFGFDFLKSVLSGGYEALSSPMAILFADLIIIVFIPTLYLASRIVKDRPFSSYSSSRGGWNFKLYFKALVIPLIMYIIYGVADATINGSPGTPNFSIAFLLVILISVPLQSIAEEYAYRGFLMQTFGSWFKIPVLAIVIQAILFALSHGYNSLGLIETLVSGLGLGFLAWKTNGIEVSSAIHSANNFSVGLFVMLGMHASSSSPQFWDVVSSCVFLAILYIIMYFIGKKTNWFGEIPENS